MPLILPARASAETRPAAGAGPEALYRRKLEAGLLRADPAQQRIVARLAQLDAALRGDRRTLQRGWRARLGRGERMPAAPRGLYLWGPVGRGKSMLMDLFFAGAAAPSKRRVHFHAFMLDVHDRIERERRAGARQPIVRVAADLAAEAGLLCFDEFQVTNIADAMILERLFRALFDAGTIVVATANRPPERLYEDGLQRDRFLPFIALLEERLDRLELDSGRDYRLARMLGQRVYHWPLGAAARAALEAAFATLTEGAAGKPETLIVMQRPLVVPRAAGNVAWFPFEALCARPLAAADYLAIADRFAAVIVDGVPRLDAHQRNEAQRFHVLIDALYEARTLLVASAETPPEGIYVAGDGAFEFRRTVSRLHEMQSEDYIANRARPDRGGAAQPAAASGAR